MHRNSVGVTLLIGFLLARGVATAQSPGDLNKLAIRASEYWRLAAAGERVKASSYVTSTKRENYLNSGAFPFTEPKLIGFQFTDDAERVIVRVSTKSLVGSTGPAVSVMEQPWRWTNNNWFIDPADEINPFKANRGASAASAAAAVKEIEQNFRLKTTTVSVGTVWQGSYPDFPIEFEYTGTPPIRVAADPRVPFVGINPPSALYIQPGAKTLQLRIDSENFEGPFSLPVRLTIFYKDVSIERVLRVEGTVFHPIGITQIPDSIALVAGQKFEVKVKNNTDSPVSITEIQTDGLFEVLPDTADIAAKGETIIALSVRANASSSDPQVRLQVAMPPNGVRQYTVKIRTKPPL
jgi:hypothetical protein